MTIEAQEEEKETGPSLREERESLEVNLPSVPHEEGNPHHVQVAVWDHILLLGELFTNAVVWGELVPHPQEQCLCGYGESGCSLVTSHLTNVWHFGNMDSLKMQCVE